MSNPTQSSHGIIPTQHEFLASDRCVSFGEWIDEQLAELEREFQDFVTRQSLSESFQTGRRSTR